MALTTGQKSDLISRYQQVARRYADCIAEERTLRAEYDALDFGTVLQQADLDALPGSAGITKADFTTAVSGFGTVFAAYDTGHDTNILRIAV